MQSEILYFFRTAKHLPQKAIADVLGMSQPNYSDLENDFIQVFYILEKLQTKKIN